MPREPMWLGQHFPASEKYGVSITQEQVGTAQQLLQVSVPGCFTDITHFNPHKDIKEPTSNTICQGFFVPSTWIPYLKSPQHPSDTDIVSPLLQRDLRCKELLPKVTFK